MLKRFIANKFALTVTALVAAGLVGGALFIKSNQNKRAGSDDTFMPKAEEGLETPADAPASSPSPPVTPPAPAPAGTSNIQVTSPANGARIANGTVVSGKAQVFEGRIAYRVKSNSKGQLVLNTAAVQGDSSQLSPFSFEIAFEKEPDPGDGGVLEVFSYSPKDGSEINKVIIQVTF